MLPPKRIFRQVLALTVAGAWLLSGCHHGSSSSVETNTVIVTVTGLAGSGLVLQDNATDNLSVTASGTTSFSTMIALYSTYSVTVLTQPTSPAQVCSVYDGLGAIEGVNVTVLVTCGTTGTATGRFAYVANSGAGTISAYTVDATTGALTQLAGSPIVITGSKELYQAQIDPSGSFLYVLDRGANEVYAFQINQSSGLLVNISGSPYATGRTPVSLAFDSSGAYMYVANNGDNTISAFTLTFASGALAPVSGSPFTIPGANPAPQQIARSGDYLFVADYNANSVDVFVIAESTGALTENALNGAPFATDTGPRSVAVDPTGKVLYTANAGPANAGSITAFTVDLSAGVLTPVVGNPLPIPVINNITIDNPNANSQNPYLFVPESAGLAVYPIVNTFTGELDAPVVGSPFATGTNPYSVSIDLTDQFVYVGNDGSANVSEFTFNAASGVLTPVAGSPVAAGSHPDFIQIQ
jgi:6-phosphogluconolactonase (cycloisomerase 2 family)